MKEKTLIKMAKRAIKNKSKAEKKGIIIAYGDTVYIPIKNDYPQRVEIYPDYALVDQVPFIGY